MSAHLGLDIGSYSIKLAQVEKKGKEYQLTAYGETRTPANPDSEIEADQLAIAEAIKKLVLDCKPTTKAVVLSLSELNVYSQTVELPYLNKNELNSAINFEAEQYIPIPLEEIQLEYLTLRTPPKEAIESKMEVLLLGAKKRALERLVKIAEKAELLPIAAETETFALNRGLAVDPSKTGVLLDFGNRGTNITVVKNQTLQFVRNIATGSEALTRAIADALNMDQVQAEQYKINYGIDENQLEGKVAKAMMPVLSIILEEIKRALAFFNQKHQGVKYDFIILAGGGAEMHGLSIWLAQALNLEVLMANPFVNFIKDDKFPKEISPARFATAIGLAIREDE